MSDSATSSKTLISGKTQVVGVWGCPVSHSRSPEMQNAALNEMGLDWVYVPFHVEPHQLEGAVNGIRSLNLVGVNVTVPHKEAIIPLLDWISPDAERIGAVNTVWNDHGTLRGYSTDGPGFLESLAAWNFEPNGKTVCLLGAGGSARSVAFALAAAGARVLIHNRTSERALQLVSAVNATEPNSCEVWTGVTANRDVALVVNATSLGMYPNTLESPILPDGMLSHHPHVYDLIYTPGETRLLELALAQHCAVKNGLDMLAYQGAHALSIWTKMPVQELPISTMLGVLGK